MKKWILPAFALGSIFMAACSDGRQTTGTSEEAEGITAVTDWEVAGVSQKGPFVTGSAVTVQELDGITLKQTGKSFKGSIKSDKGDFTIKDINLESQYAILEATGYYRDEVSGKKSSGTVTLRALTDLSNRKTVNINLLTHLEYERVMYLVTKKKMSIAEAKAQAEEEVLASFGIEGDFGKSEDLDIFKSGDGNAALLAVSVLLQSDVDVAGLTERMGEFSISLAEGGSWDDADAKTAIADWACDVDLKGSLSKVRKNVEDWKYADTVPAFEKYVTNFWWDNYGLGVCSDKRENETKRNINKLSKLYNEYFVCERGRWHIPGDEPGSSSSADSDPSGMSYGIMKDSRDGQEYKTVRIGNQVWMAENLNYAIEGSRCYGDDKKNCEKYGRLYNWDIALDTISEGCGVNFDKCTLKEDFYPRQGVCPDGWHLPDAGEWDDLLEYAGNNDGVDEAGFSLQSYYWDDDWEKQYGTDKFGFNAMAAGMFDGEEYVGLDSTAVFWTSRVSNMSYIIGGSFSTLDYVMFEKKDTDITTYRSGNVEWALSVRCVKGTGNKGSGSEGPASSSSSVTNPFLSSSSRPETHDTIPELTGNLAFLESFIGEYKSYMTFENEKQKVWYASKMMPVVIESRDSALAVLADTLTAQGFEYVGKMMIDKAFCEQSGDSSFVYAKRADGVTNRIYITRVTKIENAGFLGLTVMGYGYDLKIVVLEDGMEEHLTVNCNSLEYEKELPEEVRFIGDFGDYSNRQGWSDDSLMTFWFVDGWTHDSWRDTATCAVEGRSEIETRLDDIKSALVEKGFTLVKDGPVEVSSRYYTHSSVLVQDGRIQVSFYEMETEKALYKLEVYSGVSEGGDVFAPIYRYMFFVDIRTYYNHMPE